MGTTVHTADNQTNCTFEFLAGINVLEGTSSAFTSSFPKIPEGRNRIFNPLLDELRKADNLFKGVSKWPEDRQTLLNLYIGWNPLLSRRRELSRIRDRRKKQEETEQGIERRKWQTKYGRIEDRGASYIIDPGKGREFGKRMK